MKVLIVEDEKIAAQRLVDMLREIDHRIEVKQVIDSVQSFQQYVAAAGGVNADLIFMDVELGDGQSFAIFKETQIDIPVIFITAYQEHALRAFKLNSVDYLLKPLNKDDLQTAVAKYEKYYVAKQDEFAARFRAVLSELKASDTTRFKERFLAKNGTRLISVAATQIAYFYTKDKIQYIKTINNQDFIVDKKLDEIELEVDQKTFFRANRQFIVNYENIDKVHAWFSGKLKVQVRPEPHEEIIVSRLKAADFKRWLGE